MFEIEVTKIVSNIYIPTYFFNVMKCSPFQRFYTLYKLEFYFYMFCVLIKKFEHILIY